MAPRTKRAEQAEATRLALVEAATALFVEQGYAATSTDEVVARAGVGTRGALYHHFSDKTALFEAVFLAVYRDLDREISERIAGDAGGTLAHLRTRVSTFLDVVSERADVRALLTEGPVALGWRRFRAIELVYGADPIQALLDKGVADGGIAGVPTGPLATLVVAAIDAAALEVAESNRPKVTKVEVAQALDLFLRGLGTTNDGAPPTAAPVRPRR